MKRTTYAEERGEWVYDWSAILWNIEHGLFTEEEMREWQGASYSWVTCACGNQCADIPRSPAGGVMQKGTPLDDDLRDLGAKFYGSINNIPVVGYEQERAIYCAEARITLAAIEKRAAELLKEMEK